MGKVLEFPGGKKEWAEAALKAFMEQGEAIAVAIYLPDGGVLTAYWDCDLATKQILIGHMQADAIMDCVNLE